MSRTRTVLVADDEEIVRLVLAEMLERLGLKVLIAEDGFEALHVFRENSELIDIVVFDMTMPNMQGDELFYSIRELSPDVKMVLSSGMLGNITVEDMIANGLDGYLPKPYSISQIEAVINELPDRPSR